MNTTTDDFSSQIPISIDDIGKTLTASLPGVDAARVDRFKQLGQMRDAKARSLSREQTMLAQKHGTAEHPRIAQAQQRFATNEAFRREIAVVTEVSETPLPEADANTLIVHGFVRRRSDSAGIPGLTLALTDREGNWVRELGYACTDQRGYFILESSLSGARANTGAAAPAAEEIKANLNLEEAKREAEAKAKAAAANQTGQTTGTGAATESTGTTASKRSLLLRVFDSNGHVLHTEARPVAVKGGNVDYRYILLGDDAAECGCMPPPAKAGGRPSASGPKTAETPPSTALPPSQNQAPAPARVVGLKSYQQPDPAELEERGQPLEAIRGIGPKSADKLRHAGIKNVGDFEQRRGAEFVKLAGFDQRQPKSQPAAPQTTQPAAAAAAPTPPTRIAEGTQPAKAAPAVKQPAAHKPAPKRTKKK